MFFQGLGIYAETRLTSTTTTFTTMMTILSTTVTRLPLLLVPILTTVHAAQNGTTTTGTNLGGGIITRTDVQDRAWMARDIRDMHENLQQNDFVDARNIYLAGKNSPQYDVDGNLLPDKRSLAKMSTDAPTGKFELDVTFLFHLYGLAGLDLNTVGQHFTYADAFVRQVLEDPNSGTVAAEAALVLNLGMYAQHELWDGIRDCAQQASGANLKVLGIKDNGNGAYSIDEFIAFYIGSDQTPASTEGYSLYALAQQAAALFGTNERGEADVNTHIKSLYEQMAQTLSFPNACQPGTDTVQQLWTHSYRIISQMYVPLIQMLIHALKSNDVWRIRLYATAIVPQMSQCRQSTYRRLKENLLDRVSSYDPNNFNSILTDLEEMYDCLGFTCEDVGTYQNGQVPECAGFPETYPLALYSPTSLVHQHGKIDLDIHQISVLMKLQAWSVAKNLYLYGRNSAKLQDNEGDPYKVRSVHEMATSSLRTKATPYYEAFANYHDDANYADTFILNCFDGNEKCKWRGNPTQRFEYIDGVIKGQVVEMYILAELADCNTDCHSGNAYDNEGSVHSWDEVAAFYIGSLEGVGQGGSDYFEDGHLIWNLANRRCHEFKTCNAQSYASMNDELEDLLYAGKGQLDAHDCNTLRDTVRKVEQLSFVPIIQSVIRYAIDNEKEKNLSSGGIAAGEAYAMAILPFLGEYDMAAAEDLSKNMVLSPGQEPVEDGAQAVADSFHQLMVDFGIPCQYVGSSGSVDACRRAGVSEESRGSLLPSSQTTALVASLIAALAACALIP